jgi:hypothetical protein
MTTYQTLTNAVFGMAGSFLGVVSTFQEQFDWSIRITGGVVGLVVGLISLYRLICSHSK